jgi:UDP-N-acetylglucosamine--N-acetylmuramyl-(pentapeptide) pyrophosphoryl-undecaprenol N-acetylglucosamine transferase
LPRILYGISPIGLGHATRSLVLVEELRRKGVDVRIFSGGNAAEFMRDSGVQVESTVDDAVPRTDNLEMSRVALWYVRSWLAQRRNVRRTERLFDAYRPDLVVCDEEFSGIAVAEKRGTKRVFIADELQLGFARTWIARRIEQRVERWYTRLQSSVDLLIVPETGNDVGNVRFVGPMVRRPTRNADAVREEYGFPPGKMVLFSMSGSGIGRELGGKLILSMARGDLDGAFLVITGRRGTKLAGERVYDIGVVKDNQDLVAAADVVVSTAGKSTIDEAAAAGTPIITIPIRHHAEQERNASALGYSSDDAERLTELIASRMGKKEPPREFRGEQLASELILSLL